MSEEIAPEKTGERNQEATTRTIRAHSTEFQPLRTIVKPTVAPTILCVPEIGILSAVAIMFQAADPKD